MARATVASLNINDTQKLLVQSLQEQVNLLQEEKTKLQKALDTTSKVNEELGCVYNKVKLFLDEVQTKYVVDGKWVTLGISGWINFGKLTFTFVKSTLSECFNVTFNPRLPSWISQIIDFITKNI